MWNVKERVRLVKRDVLALWIAARDARTPWHAKALAMAIAAYALSPIDLIPDFIPVIGYLDDMIVVPLGVLLVVSMIPSGLMDEYRRNAERMDARPVSKIAAAAIVLLWIVSCAWFVTWLAPLT